MSRRLEVLKDWSNKNERNLSEFSDASHFRALWECHICHYEWKTSIKNRIYHKNGCPSCAEQAINPGYNDAYTKYQDIFDKEWDWNRNDVNPNLVGKTSMEIGYWKCPNHKDPYPLPIRQKLLMKRGCTYCSGKVLLQGFNDFLTVNPTMAKLWDFDKNENTPELSRYYTSSKYHFKCNVCSGKFMRQSNRTLQKTNCPYCVGKKILKGNNDLASNYPEIAMDWDYEKNDKTPEETFLRSNKSVHWKCHKCGKKWKNSVTNRTIRKDGCKKCNSTEKVSLKEKHLLSIIQEKEPNELIEENVKYPLSDKNFKKEIDIYFPNHKIGIEFNGMYFHSCEATLNGKHTIELSMKERLKKE